MYCVKFFLNVKKILMIICSLSLNILCQYDNYQSSEQ